MDRAGEKLRRARERLKLTYRDVVEASHEIAALRASSEFLIPLSRLADIENGGRVPTVFRLYTLAAIYRLDFHEILRWYGVPLDLLASEALQVGLGQTHPFQITPPGHTGIPLALDGDIDLNHTSLLSQFIRRLGKIPLALINGFEHQHYRYGLVGLEDASMFPILRPGSLVMIDESRRRVARAGWTSEFDRPIYFLEHRQGFACGWCWLENNKLILQPHPSSDRAPSVFQHPEEIEVVGQVVGVATLLEPKKRRHVRPSATPVMSPDPPGTTAARSPARRPE
jgi:transcriptional regulator with XRE-family HTH domain